MDEPAQLVDLARAIGCEIAPDSAEKLVAYLDAMLDENTRVNLTAVRDRESALLLHALDSLGLGLVACDPSRALDLGTGNGFPGIAIHALFPTAHVTLLDRTRKKVAAIERALRRAEIDDARVHALADDAAQLPAHGGRASFRLITARAVATPKEVGKLAAPLLEREGVLALWLSEDAEAPEKLAGGLVRREVSEYDLPEPANRTRRIAAYTR